MVLWTPAARNAVGGTTDAIQSLVLAAVANANLAYANSGVHAQLRLVYSGEVNYTETPSNISGDLDALSTSGDGKIDQAQSLRAQYGADVVTLIGNGYAANGSCGIGYIMSTVSTSFAPYAYTVVDQSCAAGYLSYAHEVGHNEGLQHDPANAGSAPSLPVRLRLPGSRRPVPDGALLRWRDAHPVFLEPAGEATTACRRARRRRTTRAR